MDYFKKIEENPYADLYWNIPEIKQGSINVIGGNGQSFRTPVKVAEFLAGHYPVHTINTVLPDVLQGRMPAVEGLIFGKSTDTGSFANGEELAKIMQGADFNLLVGDFSKNTVTARAVVSAINGDAVKSMPDLNGRTTGTSMVGAKGSASQSSDLPLLITRDGVDIVAEYQPERTLMRENLILLASLPQLQKLLRAVYYPKMLIMTQSLVQVVEVLHKFTLSYPCKIITLHLGQILVASDGAVVAVPVEKSGYSPLMVWGGELAGKIVALNLYNPNQFMKATVAGVFAG